MTSPDGGFYCAQDADSQGVEGKFYTFTLSEILDILGDEKGKRFAQVFDITANGNFEGVNIPNLLKSNDLNSDFSDEIQMLYDYRKKRTRLHLDDKILISWNSLMIAALSALYRASHNEKYLQAAKKAQDFIENNLCDDKQLYTSYRDGKWLNKAFLDDYVFYTAALIEMYNSTLDNMYLDKAQQFCDETIKQFADGENRGYYLNKAENSELFINPKETYDGALPSGNSVMAYNLVRLYQLTEKEKYRILAEKHIEFLSVQAQSYPAGHCMFLLAKLIYDNPPDHITVVLKDKTDLKKIKDHIPFFANISVVLESENYPLLNDKTTYYICKNYSCLPPANII